MADVFCLSKSHGHERVMAASGLCVHYQLCCQVRPFNTFSREKKNFLQPRLVHDTPKSVCGNVVYKLTSRSCMLHLDKSGMKTPTSVSVEALP